MSMAIPVVVTDIGQMSEIISHLSTGILVDNPTPSNFASAIQLNRDKLELIGAGARKLMIEKYDWLENAKKVTELCLMTIKN